MNKRKRHAKNEARSRKYSKALTDLWKKEENKTFFENFTSEKIKNSPEEFAQERNKYFLKVFGKEKFEENKNYISQHYTNIHFFLTQMNKKKKKKPKKKKITNPKKILTKIKKAELAHSGSETDESPFEKNQKEQFSEEEQN